MPVAAPCGSCPDCEESTRQALRRFIEQRDPLVSYGSPPKLNPEFQRTGKGTMFVAPDRVRPVGMPHFPVHLGAKRGVMFPTWPVTEKQLRRHIKLYGAEFTSDVPIVKGTDARRARTYARVMELHDQALTSAEISDRLGLTVKTVERHLRAA
jgi:hypothetical protein